MRGYGHRQKSLNSNDWGNFFFFSSIEEKGSSTLGREESQMTALEREKRQVGSARSVMGSFWVWAKGASRRALLPLGSAERN
jgi:hypothetical protein